jgi:hypothetical protein
MVVVFLILATILLSGSFYLNIKWIRMLLRIEDNCQSALGYMEKRHESINQLLHESHLIADDDIARQFVEEIRLSQNGILYAMNVLNDPSVATIESMLDEESEEEEESERDD